MRVDVDVSSHAGGMGQSQAPGNPMWMGQAREKREFCSLRKRYGEKQGRGWARSGPAIALALGGRWIRSWHLRWQVWLRWAVGQVGECGLRHGGA